MVEVKCKKLAVIQAKTGAEFENAVNSKMLELCAYQPELEIEHNMPFVAYIRYNFHGEYPETLADAMYLKGFRNICKDCGHCERRLTQKGTYNATVKSGYCNHLDRQVTLTRGVCDKFYMDRLENDNATAPEMIIAKEFLGAIPGSTSTN